HAAPLWPAELPAAIAACRVLLLMLSPASLASRHVAREVALASQGGKSILPLLLEPTTLTGSLRYHLADVQHLELFGADPQQKLPAILRALARLGTATPALETAAPPSLIASD